MTEDDDYEDDDLDDLHPALRGPAAFRAWLKDHPPRCLSAVKTTWFEGEVKPDNEIAVAYSLSGDNTNFGRVRAHTLADVNPQTTVKSRVDLGPVHVAWQDRPDAPVPIFDSKVHGYHGEYGHSSKMAGHGVGRVRTCEHCGSEWFNVRATFDFHAVGDLEDEPHDFPVENYFVGVLLDGTCCACQKQTLLFQTGGL